MWRPERGQLGRTMIPLVVAAVVAGCSAAAPQAPAVASATGSASLGELTQAFLAYAQCARTHGLPDLPDPVVDRQGNDSYPGWAATARLAGRSRS